MIVMSYRFDFAEYIEELRRNEVKKEIIESYEAIYGKISPDIKAQVWYNDYVKHFIQYYADAKICVPKELEEDYDWELLFALIVASYSSDYTLEKNTQDSGKPFRLLIDVWNNDTEIEKYLDDLWSFQVFRLFEIYIEEQISSQTTIASDNEENVSFNKLRIERIDAIKRAIWSANRGKGPAVYHYTSISTLNEILRSKRLRATDLRFLNDPSEKQIWYEVFNSAVAKIEKEITLEEDKKFYLKKIKERVDSYRDVDCFIVSLTELQDDLPQFDRYGDSSKGVSIGFNMRLLIDRLNDQNKINYDTDNVAGFLFGSVEYNMASIEDEVVTLINTLLDDSLSSGKTTTEFFDTISLVKKFKKDCDKIFMAIGGAKNADYEAEKEYRLYWLQERGKNGKVVDFFCRKPMIIPYVNFELGPDLLPLKEIIVGPGNDDGVVFNLKEVLRYLGYPERGVKVKKSKRKARS